GLQPYLAGLGWNHEDGRLLQILGADPLGPVRGPAEIDAHRTRPQRFLKFGDFGRSACVEEPLRYQVVQRLLVSVLLVILDCLVDSRTAVTRVDPFTDPAKLSQGEDLRAEVGIGIADQGGGARWRKLEEVALVDGRSGAR